MAAADRIDPLSPQGQIQGLLEQLADPNLNDTGRRSILDMLEDWQAAGALTPLQAQAYTQGREDMENEKNQEIIDKVKASAAEHGKPITDDQAQELADAAEEQGVEVGSDAFDSIFGAGGATALPEWVRGLIGSDANEQEVVADLVKAWNEQNPSDTVAGWDELFTRLSIPTPLNRMFVQDQLLPDPFSLIKVPTGLGPDEFEEFTGEQMKMMEEVFGVSERMVASAVRAANAFQLTRGAAQGEKAAWQPLLSIFRALEGTRGATRPMDQLKDQQRRAPTVSDVGEIYDIVTDLQRRGIKPTDKAVKDEQAARRGSISMTGNTEMQRAVARYKEGLQRYGDPGVAYIYSLDPQLATRYVGSKGDVSVADQQRIGQLLLDGQFDPNIMQSLGFFYDPSLAKMAANPGGGGTERIRVKPDPEAVKQATVDLWRSFFRADPSDAQVAGFAQQIEQIFMSAAEDQGIDVNAQLRSLIQKHPEYSRLYGNKPSGLSEEAYVAQFVAAQKDLLGQQEANPEAVRQGMATGDYQTTLGAVFGSKQAWGNSRLLGRLASAAQLVNANT